MSSDGGRGALGGSASGLPHHAPQARNSAAEGWLALLAIVSTCLYGGIALLSWQFDFDSVPADRPILAVVGLLAAAFVAYAAAIWLVWQTPESRRGLRLIVSAAVVYRIVMLFSVPIQEIDIYRYLWDGAVSATGESPFRYSPGTVREATLLGTKDVSLRALVMLRDGHPALAEALRRVHFAELPTVYPTVSQAVFAAAAMTTPRHSAVLTRVFVMKAWLIMFDLATLGLVIVLLRLCHKPVGLCVMYGWCPLLLKEVANSGHLDAIAVFFTTLAVVLAVRMFVRESTPRRWLSTTAGTTLVAVSLALGIGAKLYPVVLAPLFLLSLANKLGWRCVPIPAAVCAGVALLFVWPMMPQAPRPLSVKQAATAAPEPSLPVPPHVSAAADPGAGMTAFLRHWKMNDFIFQLVEENLKPVGEWPPGRTTWFSIVPDIVRRGIAGLVTARLHIEAHEVPFLVARAITGTATVIVALVLAWCAARSPEPARFCEAGFLTLAWLWLLCPTQNPWYWTWTLPLLPFARSRAWLAMSGLVLMYYLRFWFSSHWPNSTVLGTPYIGFAFFDFVVTWVEFAPWLVCLTLGSVATRGTSGRWWGHRLGKTSVAG